MTITSEYYDGETYDLLYKTLTEDDKAYININTTHMENTAQFLFKRWNIIVNSLPDNYYKQYAANHTMRDRNDWFKKYLDYPTKDISQMPDLL